MIAGGGEESAGDLACPAGGTHRPRALGLRRRVKVTAQRPPRSSLPVVGLRGRSDRPSRACAANGITCCLAVALHEHDGSPAAAGPSCASRVRRFSKPGIIISTAARRRPSPRRSRTRSSPLMSSATSFAVLARDLQAEGQLAAGQLQRRAVQSPTSHARLSGRAALFAQACSSEQRQRSARRAQATLHVRSLIGRLLEIRPRPCATASTPARLRPRRCPTCAGSTCTSRSATVCGVEARCRARRRRHRTAAAGRAAAAARLRALVGAIHVAALAADARSRRAPPSRRVRRCAAGACALRPKQRAEHRSADRERRSAASAARAATSRARRAPPRAAADPPASRASARTCAERFDRCVALLARGQRERARKSPSLSPGADVALSASQTSSFARAFSIQVRGERLAPGRIGLRARIAAAGSRANVAPRRRRSASRDFRSALGCASSHSTSLPSSESGASTQCVCH